MSPWVPQRQPGGSGRAETDREWHPEPSPVPASRPGASGSTSRSHRIIRNPAAERGPQLRRSISFSHAPSSSPSIRPAPPPPCCSARTTVSGSRANGLPKVADCGFLRVHPFFSPPPHSVDETRLHDSLMQRQKAPGRAMEGRGSGQRRGLHEYYCVDLQSHATRRGEATSRWTCWRDGPLALSQPTTMEMHRQPPLRRRLRRKGFPEASSKLNRGRGTPPRCG